MNAIITGGTGLVGRALAYRHSAPIILSRAPERYRKQFTHGEIRHWAPSEGVVDPHVLRGGDVVFNLAGESVAGGRWTPAKKDRIRDSRVLGTRNLVAGLAKLDQRPRVLVSASAVGFYGDRKDQVLDESASMGRGFLAEVCQAWEREAMRATELGIRVVCLRIGVVLSREGGALARIVPPFKLGTGGRIGSGQQWMPWIHLDDLVDLLLHVSQTDISGVMNAVAPEPVTNLRFTRAMAAALRRPALIPVPRRALRIALGEMGDILLHSQRVVPRLAEASGYTFRHRELEGALATELSAPRGGRK